MHYYQFHINDFIAETHFLSNSEISIYLKLFNQYLHEEKPLKNNMNFLQRLCGGSEDEVRNVLNLFFELNEDNWHRDSLDLIIHDYQSNKEANSRGGKKSALSRKKKLIEKSTSSVLQLTNNQEPLIINQELETINEKIIHNNLLNIDFLETNKQSPSRYFEEFWNMYPKKIGKESARREWERLGPDIGLVKETLSWQKESKVWNSDGGRNIPIPAKYLSEYRYEELCNKEILEMMI